MSSEIIKMFVFMYYITWCVYIFIYISSFYIFPIFSQHCKKNLTWYTYNILNIPQYTNKLAVLTGLNSQPDSLSKNDLPVCCPTVSLSLTITAITNFITATNVITSSAYRLIFEHILLYAVELMIPINAKHY